MNSTTSFLIRFGILIALLASLPMRSTIAEPDPGFATVGKHTYRTYCASCHGTLALGDGPVAAHLVVKPADLTRISARNGGTYPAERVFKIIDGREKVRGHGNSEMPIWGDAFSKTNAKLDEEQVRRKIEGLVHHLESIQVP